LGVVAREKDFMTPRKLCHLELLRERSLAALVHFLLVPLGGRTSMARDGGSGGKEVSSAAAFRDALVEGVKGIDQVPAELKDIAASEALELLGAVYEALKA
jgi:hypothetical protein